MNHSGDNDFFRSILYAITTTPSLRELYESLVLRGDVALSLRRESGRTSREDVDFGLSCKDRMPTQQDFENLLVALQDWSAVPKGSRDIVSTGEGVDTPVMSYIHPLTRERGGLKLQTSGMQVPPVLEAETAGEDMVRFTTYDGKPFMFRVMRLEDLYDIECRVELPGLEPTDEEFDLPTRFYASEVRAGQDEARSAHDRLLRHPDGRLRTVREIRVEVGKGAAASRAALDSLE